MRIDTLPLSYFSSLTLPYYPSNYLATPRSTVSLSLISLVDKEEKYITRGKDGKHKLGVSTTVSMASFPPNKNGITGSKSENASAPTDTRVWRGVIVVVVVSPDNVEPLCCLLPHFLPTPLLSRSHPVNASSMPFPPDPTTITSNQPPSSLPYVLTYLLPCPPPTILLILFPLVFFWIQIRPEGFFIDPGIPRRIFLQLWWPQCCCCWKIL